MPQNVTGKSACHIAGVNKCLLFLDFLEVAGNGFSEIPLDHNKRLGWVFLFVLLLLLLFVFGFVGFLFVCFFFLAALCNTRALSSPTRDRTRNPCTGSVES